MPDDTPILPGLSPVDNLPIHAKFDGGAMSSNGGALLLREAGRSRRLSAVVDVAEPPKPERKPLKGKNEVAMQALYDALGDHGETRTGKLYPSNRKVVHVDRWREACDVHGLTSGTSDSAGRQAFKRAKDTLMDMDEVRQHGDHVWRVQDDD